MPIKKTKTEYTRSVVSRQQENLFSRESSSNRNLKQMNVINMEIASYDEPISPPQEIFKPELRGELINLDLSDINIQPTYHRSRIE